MTGSLDMGGKQIKNLGSSNNNTSAITVGDVKANYLNLNGTKSMTGQLNMGNEAIKSVLTVDINPSDNNTLNYAATNKSIKDVQKDMQNKYFQLSGGSMTGNINMNNHSIVNLKEPEDYQATYATNVKFVVNAIVDNNTMLSTLMDTKIEESEERSIEAVQQENVFKKFDTDDLFKEDDDDLHKVG